VRRIGPERHRIAVDGSVGGYGEEGRAGARDDGGAAHDVGQADALRAVIKCSGGRSGRRPRRFATTCREDQYEKKKSFHARYSERSTTILVTSAIFITAPPILRNSDMRLRRTLSSSTMTMTSLKNASSSGAMAAKDSSARRYSRVAIMSSICAPTTVASSFRRRSVSFSNFDGSTKAEVCPAVM